MTQVVPILRVADVKASLAWWQRAGFVHDFTHRYGGGTTHRFMGIRRDGADVFLSENPADDAPQPLPGYWLRPGTRASCCGNCLQRSGR